MEFFEKEKPSMYSPEYLPSRRGIEDLSPYENALDIEYTGKSIELSSIRKTKTVAEDWEIIRYLSIQPFSIRFH